ncbi:MAG TPA: hypothetical protein VGA36_00155 [Nitriliruptorales bacterium]
MLSSITAVLIALLVLPSALNVPQSSPSQTLEFAPVPPDDEDPPPDVSNVESLSLGTSSSIPGDAPGGAGPELPPPPSVPGGVGARPVTKRCVGNPPRQTEDELSPPCVAHFEGDNGGMTHAGVTEAEIQVVFYSDCGTAWLTPSRGADPDVCGASYDLGEPATPDNQGSAVVRILRAFQRYFNERYQTYGRKVRIHVYFSDNADYATTPEERRADATRHYLEVEPFATFTNNTYMGYEDAYLEEMARRGSLIFGSEAGRSEAFFLQYPGYIWGYPPTVETMARQFGSVVCNNMVGRPVSFTRDQALHGQPRRLGLLWVDNGGADVQFRIARDVVDRMVTDCGGTFVEERTYSEWENASGSDVFTAQANVAAFQSADVTTIVWPGGFETLHSDAAGNIGYFPEVVIEGGTAFDGYNAAREQDQDFWDQVWTTSNAVLGPPIEDSDCVRAAHEGDPSMPMDDIKYMCTYNTHYEILRQMFTGIQVAGPRLTPATIDQGFHAIPAVRSDDPAVPACYYDPGDYTCVKDAVLMWWDRTGTPRGGYDYYDRENLPRTDQDQREQGQEAGDGCYRMITGGLRYPAGQWPDGDLPALEATDDPCANHRTSYFN